MTPFANSFVAPERAVAMEPFHPLRAVVCSGRRPVKLADFESSEAVVSDRPYFPSFSEAWPANVPAHAERTTETLGLGPRTPVVEVASNDGHLPRYSARRGIPAPATGRRRATDAVRAGQAPGPRSTWTP